jgi:hypothetical protein
MYGWTNLIGFIILIIVLYMSCSEYTSPAYFIKKCLNISPL